MLLKKNEIGFSARARVLAILCLFGLVTGAVGQCVIPGATTIIQSTAVSPLAADTGKIYYITGATTMTLPSIAPTAVWRISFQVKSGGSLTVNPNGLNIDNQASNEVFKSGSAGTISVDAATSNYWTSGKSFSVRSCDIPIGDTSASALTNGQLGPQKRLCYMTDTATVIEVAVAADAGTPNVITGVNHAGTTVNLVSTALATAASGGIACSNTTGAAGRDGTTTCSSTLQNTAILPGDYIELVSGTAGGTAKLMAVHVLYSIHDGN